MDQQKISCVAWKLFFILSDTIFGIFSPWKYISYRLLFQTNVKKSCLYPQFLILLHTHVVLYAGMVQWHI